MRRLAALFLFCAAAAGALAADPAADAARAELARERKRLTSDTRALAELSRRLEVSLSQLASSSRAVADAAARSDSGPDEIARREDSLEAAEQEVRVLLERRRLLADRVLERRRTIAALESDLQAKRTPDNLSGRWAVTLEPGEQGGVFRMSLDGTIVSGEYTLDGGYSGSLRGTLVNDRLRLERVDSKLGFSAVYFGRLLRDGSISGTWEATTFGGGAPGSGRWKAVREEEREESR